MSTGESTEKPTTLAIAHRVLAAAEPPKGAPRSDWVTYYRRSARVYEEVADIDRGHHHEALYWVGRMQRKADEVQRQIEDSRPRKKPTETKTTKETAEDNAEES